jgi:hypothetical protein
MTSPTDPEELPAVSRLDRQAELPSPFETLDGERVETREDWEHRRTELKRLLRHYVYGYAPGSPELDVSVEGDAGGERTGEVLDGAATLREVTLRFADLPEDAPSITLAVFLPADRDGAVPTVLALNAFGNHATVPDEAVTATPTGEEHDTTSAARESGTTAAAEERGMGGRGALADYWCVEYVVERGYGFATCHCADIDPDDDDAAGIRPYFDDDLPGPPGTEWGTLAAWAWGLQRCVDYLRTDDAVRDGAIAVLGHSRCGKAALLAGATDERVGLVAPHQSGTGGMALARENGQESVGDITEMFPHWFADTFSAAAGQVDRLPVDQHLLAALVAPRPLVDTEGARDYWANPGRALDALEAADPVYELLGVEGLTGDEPLYGDDEITEETVGRLLQYRRETEHTLNRGYWEAVLDFADVHFEG